MATSIRPTVLNLAAAATNASVLAGNRFEFMPRTSHIAIYAITHAAGAPTSSTGITNSVFMTVSFGNVILLDGGSIPLSTTGLKINEHLMVSGVASGGDRLIISVTNGTGVAIDIPILVVITDL